MGRKERQSTERPTDHLGKRISLCSATTREEARKKKRTENSQRKTHDLRESFSSALDEMALPWQKNCVAICIGRERRTLVSAKVQSEDEQRKETPRPWHRNAIAPPLSLTPPCTRSLSLGRQISMTGLIVESADRCEKY